jgi:DNA-binding PadR family transcriptional regulator
LTDGVSRSNEAGPYARLVATALPDLSLPEWLVLALVCEGLEYGWPIVRELAPDGDLGQVWTVSRAKVYRAIDQVTAKGYLQPAGHRSAGGPERTLLRPTAATRRLVDRWLIVPVQHVRDLRSELLLKLVLAERRGRDIAALAAAQREAIAPQLDRWAAARPSSVVESWRKESAAAARRFLDRLATH